MRERRIFHPERLNAHTEVTLSDQAVRHVIQVLRLQVGDRITLFDGGGLDYMAAVLLISRKNGVRVKVGQVLRKEPAAQLQVHLAIGVSRGERMDFSLQKSVELGVGRITPLLTERTLVRLKGEKRQARLTHWRGVIQHACEQCGRSYLPALHPMQSFEEFVTRFSGQGILLDHRAESGLGQLTRPEGELTLLVGPEGGLAPQERDQAMRQGLTSVRLGPRILRTETAPLAALASMQMLWGDFR